MLLSAADKVTRSLFVETGVEFFQLKNNRLLLTTHQTKYNDCQKVDRFVAQRITPLYARALLSTRSGALFNAFSYPTKISPESIALFIATHTEPGATVLDPFGGSGTTGIAAKLCARPTEGMKTEATRLGLDAQWGLRNVVLYELSTIGSLLARTMCSPPNPKVFERGAKRLVKEATAALGWMYESEDPKGAAGYIRHVIWSDVLMCPHCGTKATFWDSCVRLNPTAIVDAFVCSGCKRTVHQSDCGRQIERVSDPMLSGTEREVRKRIPVRVHGVTGTAKWQRAVVESDLAVLERVLRHRLKTWVPTDEIYWGDLYRSGYHQGIDRYHHFYTYRNLCVLSHLWDAINDQPEELRPSLRLLVLSFNAAHSTLMTRVVAKKGQNDLVLTGAQSGVLYVSSLPVEKNILEGVERKIRTFKDAFSTTYHLPGSVSVINASSTRLDLGDQSIDYVFTDPPFGAYIPYAELNQVNEAWLGSLTDRSEEAIVSPAQGKSVDSYELLLKQVFAEVARVIKPAGAATIVFHSSKAKVWNAASNALTSAGFEVVATNVLDKTQVSFKQANSSTSSRGDALILVRPASANRTELASHASGKHILQRVFARAVLANDAAELQPERLYSRYAGYCLRHGLPLNYDTAEVYALAKAAGRIDHRNPTSSAVSAVDRKRLGQYFSGGQVAMLLAALSGPDRVKSVIDPMAGNGDMLIATLAVGLGPERLAAVEIEDSAFRRCSSRLEALHLEGSHHVEQGNAFDPAVVASLGLEAWDLVITNPPYVRYQTGSSKAGKFDLPSADEVRDGLTRILTEHSPKDSNYARFLREKSLTYSGLADLAVPSWLLCAALVRPGGALAMVVPDTWLTRDYAAPIHELLDEFFDIDFVVEDGDVSWFPDALMRTNLVVARRREPGVSARPTLRVRLSCNAASAQSLVGALFENDEPEVTFAAAARQWLANGLSPSLPGCEIKASGKHGMSEGAPGTLMQKPAWRLPASLGALVTPTSCPFTTLDELGWSVGQGLRTGANVFFYVEIIDDDGETARVRTNGRIGKEASFSVPSSLLRRVVQRQADLPSGRLLDPQCLSGGVLVLDGYARAADRHDVPVDRWNQFFLDLPSAILKYVTAAETTNIGSTSDPRSVPDLSAVHTNVRRFDPSHPDRAPRFWYHLPPFALRHSPDLMIPRVNYRHPRVVLNPGRGALVDANFSTLWASMTAAIDPYAMLAVLSSAWMATLFEASATPMAGGALKLEATHLRHLPLPCAIRQSESELIELGVALADASDERPVLKKINTIIFSALELSDNSAEAVTDLGRRLLEGRAR